MMNVLMRMMALVACGVVLACALPALAFADGGVELVQIASGSIHGGIHQDVTVVPGEDLVDVPTQPSGFTLEDGEREDGTPSLVYFAVLEFSKNVSYAREGVDDAFIEENLARVHLRNAQTGVEVPMQARAGGTMEERQLIYVETPEWLEPLTAYELVVDEGIVAANGLDMTTEPYTVRMVTGDLCSNGLTVAQNVLVVAVPLLLAVGVICAVLRRVREA